MEKRQKQKEGVRKMSDWTKELSEEHPDLFLSAFEERLVQAQGEVATLLRYLKEQGFRPKNILDLNCGIGRHSVEFGKRRIKVLGTDLSPRYIEIAKQRAKKENVDDRVSFRIADMREIASVLSGEKSFDGIVNLWTSFGFYDEKTNDDILRQCSSLVRPAGFFVLEIINRDWLICNLQEEGFSRVKGKIILQERHFNPENSRSYDTWSYLIKKGKKTFVLEKEIKLDFRVWSLHELISMFEKTGWKFKAAYPGLDKPRDIPLSQSKRFTVIFSRKQTRK